MKGFGFFLPFRRVIILYQKGYTLYRFWLGKCIVSQFNSQEIENEVLSKASDVLMACPIQEVYRGETPKLKYFDRPAFLFHTLNHRFKSRQWIASRWLSTKNFISLKFFNVPDQDFDQFQGHLGAFLGEVSRFNIFKEGEGCLLAPTQFGQIYEIYIKNNHLNFVRLIDQDVLVNSSVRNAEIESLKRYLERYFQANPHTLSIKWWGPNPPEDIEVYQTQGLEESIVQNYIGYINPAITFKNTISAQWFSDKNPLKKLKIFGYIMSLMLLTFIINNSFDIWAFRSQHQNLVSAVKDYKKKYQPFEQAKETAQQIKRFDEKKAIVDVLNTLKPLTSSPLPNLKKISSYLKDQVRCHELIWLCGQIVIDSLDHTLVLHPTIYEQKISSQSLILAITGPSIETFQNLEILLQKDFSKNQTIKIWTKPSAPDLSESFEAEETMIFGLLEMIEKP